jgi:hypothetical protein
MTPQISFLFDLKYPIKYLKVFKCQEYKIMGYIYYYMFPTFMLRNSEQNTNINCLFLE